MPRAIIISFSIIGIIVFLFIAVSAIANSLFNQKVTREVTDFFQVNSEPTPGDVIKKGDIDHLPSPVQKWLEYAQVTGKEKINTVRLQQQATLRLKPDGPWMAAKAQQYFTVKEPGFIWKTRIKAAPFVHVSGRDKYYDGTGHMLIKLLSLKTIADAQGPEINQGVLLRYLAETVWFPTAALSDYITWEEIDAHSAKATMNYKGVTAPGIFTFNEKGEVVSFSAKRYMESEGKYSLEDWVVSITHYGEFEGIKMPTKGELTWKLKTGDFTWFKWEITDVEYNRPEVY